MLWVSYAGAVAPYWLRDLLGHQRVGRGSSNLRFDSVDQFELDDPRRADRGFHQLDFGLGWRDLREEVGRRVTWVEGTGELIAVGGRGGSGEGGVEVIEVIKNQAEVEHRLRDWEYTGVGDSTLRWVRRRVHGWDVPLPPRAKWWLLRDHDPPVPWPAPPPPSLERSKGVYQGSEDKQEFKVMIAEPGRTPRALYHFVDSSPTGFAWGYGGSGPTDLARSLLADRLGYTPQAPIYIEFRRDIVEGLEDEFMLSFQEVDRWINDHRELFAKYPQAEPFDPFAAGGA